MPESRAHGLLRRLARGEQAALGEIYDLYAGLVHGLALRVLRDASEAEDVVQEVFVQVWRQAGRYDPGRCPDFTTCLGSAGRIHRSGRCHVPWSEGQLRG